MVVKNGYVGNSRSLTAKRGTLQKGDKGTFKKKGLIVFLPTILTPGVNSLGLTLVAR